MQFLKLTIYNSLTYQTRQTALNLSEMSLLYTLLVNLSGHILRDFNHN